LLERPAKHNDESGTAARISARKLITLDIYAQMDIRAGRLEDKNKPVLENALSVSSAFHPWQS